MALIPSVAPVSDAHIGQVIDARYTANTILLGNASGDGAAVPRDAAIQARAYSNFRDAADGSPVTLDSGQDWWHVGYGSDPDQYMRVVDGALTNLITTGLSAGYAEVDLGGHVTRIGATVTFDTYADMYGAAGLAIWTTKHDAQPTIPYAPLHMSFAPTHIGIDVWETPTGPDNLITQIFDTPLVADGETEYTVDVRIVDDTITVYLSTGLSISVSDPRVAEYAGPWAMWETYATDAATGSKARFLEVWADTARQSPRAVATSSYDVSQIVDVIAAPKIRASRYSAEPSADLAIAETTTALSDELNVSLIWPSSGLAMVDFTFYLVNVGDAAVIFSIVADVGGSASIIVSTKTEERLIQGSYLYNSSPGLATELSFTMIRFGGTSATVKQYGAGGYHVNVKVTPV